MKEKENNGVEFFDALLNIAREATNTPQTPHTVCVNQSRNINHISINVVASSPAKPGLLRRLLSKFF